MIKGKKKIIKKKDTWFFQNFSLAVVDIRRDTNQSKLTFFLTFFQMENIERHLEQGNFFLPILVLHWIWCTVHLSWKYLACSSMHSMFFERKTVWKQVFMLKHKFIGKSGLYTSKLWAFGSKLLFWKSISQVFRFSTKKIKNYSKMKMLQF